MEVFNLAGAAAVLIFNYVSADDGPVTMNANPQGLVTNANVKLTMDTQDLARCRYSTEDEDYDSMSDQMTTPDGLYHYASLGTLDKGSYTYYARCKDFMERDNNTSTQFKFNVGDLKPSGGCSTDGDCASGQKCQSGSCVTQSTGGGDTTPPTISSPLPSGTIYDSYITLSVATSEPATCRYSWYDKTYDTMTLSFTTENRYYHTVSQTLSQYGYYVVYVRCKDDAGNANPNPAKISFRYASRTPINTGSGSGSTTVVKAKDTTAPVISSLFPIGDVKEATTTISCITDEKATCKYDKADLDFDSMANMFDADATGKNFSKLIALSQAGSYTYYVRCKDDAGNKSSASSQISFTYVIPIVEGPKISNLQPAGGTIYQKNVALILQTDRAADCRYSTEDVEYDDMEEKFNTNDGLLQQATITLDKFGQYTFYVRCADKQGNKDDSSEIASFIYKDANANQDDEDTEIRCEKDSDCKDGKICQDGACQKVKEEIKPVECEDITTSKKDGACDKISDCICDPDCPLSGDDVDSDCANVKPADNSWVVLLLIGIVLVVVIVVVIVIIKRRGGGEEDVELP